MAYRFEKNKSGGIDLVFHGWEKGIADSPYLGIANMRNLGIEYYPGATYVNYKRLRACTTGGSGVFTGSTSPSQLQLSVVGTPTLNLGDAVTVSNSGGSLPTGLASSTTYFVQAINAGTGVFQLSATFGGAAISITGTGSGTSTITLTTMARPMYDCKSPAGNAYVIDSSGQVWRQNSLYGNTNYFYLLNGNPLTGAGGNGIAYWNNCLFVWRNAFLDVCGTGSGESTITSANWNPTSTLSWPIGAPSNFTMTGNINAGATSATISSYNDANGNAQSTWVYPTGVYKTVLGNGQSIDATYTFGSAAVSWTATVTSNTGSATVTITPIQSNAIHQARVARQNAQLYFCNATSVGDMNVPVGQVFSPTSAASINFNYGVALLDRTETATWLEELSTDLIIGGVRTLYTFAFSNQLSNSSVSSVQVPNTAIPINAPLSKMLNFLNNIYILAGQKGDIYIYNGYSVERYKKIPDYITSLGGNSGTGTSLIDPVWSWGGMMAHRNKLFFQALATDPRNGNGILAGIFSLDLNLTINNSSIAGALNFEAQNSFGLISSTTQASGVLIDNTPSSSGQDSYFSGWSDSSGNGSGGMDYNSTTLWSGNEPLIETDFAIVGTPLQTTTFSSFDLVLDQPLQSGDTVTLYGRSSLADSYTLIGTATSSSMNQGGGYPLVGTTFQNGVSVQLLVLISCNATATASSYVRLRELRLR